MPALRPTYQSFLTSVKRCNSLLTVAVVPSLPHLYIKKRRTNVNHKCFGKVPNWMGLSVVFPTRKQACTESLHWLLMMHTYIQRRNQEVNVITWFIGLNNLIGSFLDFEQKGPKER